VNTRTSLCTALAALAAAGTAANAERVYALVRAPLLGDSLVFFESNLPLVTSAPLPIVGMRPGEQLLGIDFRPRDGKIYGLGDTQRLYRIDPITGDADQVSPDGKTLDPQAEGDELSIDFNPRVDLVRVLTDTAQNLRVSPLDGLVVAEDGTLHFAADDTHAGETPAVVGAGYTNSFVFAATTALYDVDADLDILVKQDPPNDGTLRTIGTLNVDIGGPTGFDISPTGPAYLSVRPIPALPLSLLYTVNLSTGEATAAGTIGVNYVQDISVELFCAVDINRDRQLDFFDYLDFVQAFSNEEPLADFNRSGQIDFFDYLDFAAMFDEGC
jgi:hypothetical protein